MVDMSPEYHVIAYDSGRSPFLNFLFGRNKSRVTKMYEETLDVLQEAGFIDKEKDVDRFDEDELLEEVSGKWNLRGKFSRKKDDGLVDGAFYSRDDNMEKILDMIVQGYELEGIDLDGLEEKLERKYEAVEGDLSNFYSLGVSEAMGANEERLRSVL